MATNDTGPTLADAAKGSEGLAFVPLEANPPVLTNLLHELGLDDSVEVHDVFSLTEPDLLAMVPRPAHALLLVFPVSATYESARLAEDATLEPYAGKGDAEPVIWIRQTIRNACGMMGLLHASLNGAASEHLKPDSTLANLRAELIPLAPPQRSVLLEKSQSLATANQSAGTKGDTAAPDARADVDLHYVCFVRGGDGTLWELDGRRKGPLARAVLGPSEDVLSQTALVAGPLKFLERAGEDLRFSAVAIA